MNRALPETVYDAFEQAVLRHDERPFLCVPAEVAEIYGIEPGDLTYGDAQRKVEGIARLFAAAGYGRGHRVGLLLENRPVYFLTWFALNSLGVSVVPVNPELRSQELEYLVSHSEMIAAVVWPHRKADIVRAVSAADVQVAVFLPGEEPPTAATPAIPASGQPRNDECALLYTSGTTGLPKGCVLTNDYFLQSGEWYASVGGLCTLSVGCERMLTPLPTYHMNAMATSTMAMLATGGCLICLDRFHPRTWWQSVRDCEATVIHYLGVMPAILMGAAPTADDRDHRIKFGFGAGVPHELHVPFEERFGFPLVEAWAMTETGAGAVIAATVEPRHRGQACIGRAPPELEVRIVRDDGTEISEDEVGELWVRRHGANPRQGFFDRYLKDPQATAQAWQGGWFHTGDLVRRDAGGSLYFMDREKNVIRRSGENISAVEVEMVLGRHPLVSSVAVAAAPDALRGDEVFACVQPKRALTDERERVAAARSIVEWSLEKLAYYKAPGYVAFVERLPLTSTQKIQRRAVKELVADLLERAEYVETRALKKR